jgi:hypothetical protein
MRVEVSETSWRTHAIRYARLTQCSHCTPSYKVRTRFAMRVWRAVPDAPSHANTQLRTRVDVNKKSWCTHKVRYACLTQYSPCTPSYKNAGTYAGRCEKNIMAYARGSLCAWSVVPPAPPHKNTQVRTWVDVSETSWRTHAVRYVRLTR